MASIRQSIRSSTASKRPTSAIADGQIALNTASGTPGMFFKDSAGNIIKTGPAHYGASAPNSSPAVGGSTGNSIAEAWLDSSLTPVGWKIWNGSTWVNATPLSSDTVQGLVELATNAETQAGADTARAVTSAGLQSKVSDSVSTASSSGIASSSAVKTAYDLANAALPKSGGIITGNLEIGSTGSLTFEGSTADGFETTLAVVDPTLDRTITFPNITGTVVTTGDTGTVTSTMILDGTIVDADINASAEIAVSKLADGAARQLLQTDAAGTGVEWASNIDIPGTLDVTSAATFDSTVAVTGALTKSGNNVVTVGDTGTVTSTMILDGTILNADVNASAAIAGTKISPDFGAQTIVTTGVHSAAAGSAAAPSMTFTGDLNTGIYSPGADQVAISTGGSGRLFVDASGRVLVGTSTARAEFNNTTLAALSIPQVQLEKAGAAVRTQFALIGNPGTSVGEVAPAYILARTTGTALGSTAAVSAAAKHLGDLSFQGSDGTEFVEAAKISAYVDGTPGADDMPGRLVLSTTADGASSPTERMRIDSSGSVGIRSTAPITSAASLDVSHGTYGQTALPTMRVFRDTGGSLGDSVEETALYVRFDASRNNTVTTKGLDVYASSGLESTSTYAINASVNPRNNGIHRAARFTGGHGNVAGVGIQSVVDIVATVSGTGTTGRVRGLNIDLPNYDGVENTGVFINNANTGSTRQSPIRIFRNNVELGTVYTTSTDFGVRGNTNLIFDVGVSERARIDSSGRLLVGTSSSAGLARCVVQGNTSDATGVLQLAGNWAASSSQSASTNIGIVRFTHRASDTGSNDGIYAQIFAQTDGTTGSGDYPGRLVFSTTADGAASLTEAMRINNQRELLIGTTTRTANGGVLQVSNGITFPATQVACTNPNTLDDYEEGTFTPTVIGSTTAGTATYSTQTGTYTKIGRLVTATIFLGWSGGTGTGDLQFTGLPFSVSGASYFPASIGYIDTIALTALNYILGYAYKGTSRIDFIQTPTGGGSQSAVPYDAGGALMVTCSYFV